MVFVHEIDPSMGDEQHQGKLNSIHNPDVMESTSTTSPTNVQEALELLVKPQLPTRPQLLHLSSDLKSHLTARC